MSVKLILSWTFLVLLSHPLNGELFYSGFDDGAQTLILDGGAQIQKSGALRLTNDTSRLIGHAFSSSPARFKDSPNGTAFSFSTCFAFAIVPEYPKLGGHGMAFAISRTRGIPRALPSQYLGLLSGSNAGNSSKQFVAVEFDTVKDIELRDIDDNHVGIDMSSLISNASAPASYFAGERLKGLNLTSGSAILAFVEYDSGKNQLNVTLSPSSAKPNRPTLSFDVDLSPILDEYMYVGFSASTGLLASSHYVLGWSFNVSGEAKSLDLSSLPSLPGPRKSHKTLIAAASVAAVFVVLLLIGIAFYLVRKIKNADVIEAWELEIGPHRFSYQQLKRATRGFKDKELLGFGGFGRVYRGVLPNSKSQVAVKRISHESKQGLREFVSEIASIGRLRHRNLVQLLGWCRRRGDLLLVYDFMPNGSLDKYLFDEPKSILSWEQRFKIIKGVASGLVYLHGEWEQTVIHRDIKAGNVLLDSELNGRLGDFGLAKLYEHGANPSTTKVVGTLGYLAPELTRSGKPTASSDVFAFGALLLEVICGRRPIETKALPEELVLVDWVWQKWETGAIFEVVDPKLAGEYDEGEVALAVKLGLMCSNNHPSARPTMRQVVRYLEGEAAPPEELAAPVEYDAGKCRGGGGMGFEDYEHSYPTSSFFDKMSTCSSGGGGDVEVASASSPLSGRGDAR